LNKVAIALASLWAGRESGYLRVAPQNFSP